jgi:hypothetical protein
MSCPDLSSNSVAIRKKNKACYSFRYPLNAASTKKKSVAASGVSGVAAFRTQIPFHIITTYDKEIHFTISLL